MSFNPNMCAAKNHLPAAFGGPKPRLAGIVREIESYLAYLKENGVTEIAAGPAGAPKTNTPALAAEDIAVETATGLKKIAAEVAECTKCPLHKNRRNTVPGQGNSRPEILFVGEGPGEDEDRQGLAFVGRAGQLLTRLVVKMGFTREQVFIANVVKCRPPNNRKPEPEEQTACLPYLERQIDLLKPKVIVVLGATALEALFAPDMRITKMRGKWLEYKGIPAMPTFHPSYLFRNQSAMWDVWNDMQLVLERLGRPVPAKP